MRQPLRIIDFPGLKILEASQVSTAELEFAYHLSYQKYWLLNKLYSLYICKNWFWKTAQKWLLLSVRARSEGAAQNLKLTCLKPMDTVFCLVQLHTLKLYPWHDKLLKFMTCFFQRKMHNLAIYMNWIKMDFASLIPFIIYNFQQPKTKLIILY